MTDQLPPVGSVWRHNETGEVLIVEHLVPEAEGDKAAVYLVGVAGKWYMSRSQWLAWQTHATHLEQPTEQIISERDRQWIEAIHPESGLTELIGGSFGTPEKYAEFAAVREEEERKSYRYCHAIMEGRAATIRRLLAENRELRERVDKVESQMHGCEDHLFEGARNIIKTIDAPESWVKEGITQPSWDCRGIAIRVLAELHEALSLLPYRIGVSLSGGINLVYSNGDKQLEVEVDNELDAVATLSIPKQVLAGHCITSRWDLIRLGESLLS